MISVGIDSWAVDYGLLAPPGRCSATRSTTATTAPTRGVDTVHGRVGPEELYATTGLQYLPFNTLYQLAAEPARRPLDAGAARCC